MLFISPRDVNSKYITASFSGAGLVTSVSVAGPRRLYKAFGFCNTAGQFVQLHNLAGAPGLGVFPILTKNIATGVGQNWEIDFSSTNGILLSVGITIASSSTAATHTASIAPTLNGVLIYI